MEFPPAKIGPYAIQREIGRGGMGIVYLARESETARIVALKVLPREFTSDPVRLKRFHREAMTVRKVRHPNVVPLFGVGEADGLHYIAMKYIPGTPLDVLIRDRSGSRAATLDDETLVIGRGAAGAAEAAAAADAPAVAVAVEARPRRARTARVGGGTKVSSPVSEPQWVYRAVRIVEKIARALGDLHERGIVHRDVKPGNILVDQAGDPWLLDFGLVRDLGASTTVSDEDGLLGTVQYIAPEQIEGEGRRTDHRSDLYSLGVTLYELVTLRRPFDGQGPNSTLYAVAREAPPPPRSFNPGLSDDLEHVILKAMAKDPAMRYQTGDAFADDLRRVRTFKPVQMARAPFLFQLKQFCSRNPLLAGAMVFAALCFIGMLEYGIYREITDRRRLIELRQEADLAFDHGHFQEAAEGYRVYLRLGGPEAGVIDRLAFCRTREKAVPAGAVHHR